MKTGNTRAHTRNTMRCGRGNHLTASKTIKKGKSKKEVGTSAQEWDQHWVWSLRSQILFLAAHPSGGAS